MIRIEDVNKHLVERFTGEDVRAGTTLHPITYLDIRHPDHDAPRYLAQFWLEESERWQREYYRLTDEIGRYNEYRDPSALEAMTDELAMIAANVVEASSALTSSLRLVSDLQAA